MTTTFWLRLRLLLRVWILLVATTSPFAIFAYDAQSRTTIVYDGSDESAVDYDAISVLATGEKKNGTTGERVPFVRFAEFLAARSGQFSTIAGEGMDAALFSRMKSAFERQGGRILQGGDVEAYLRRAGVEGSTANPKFIQLRINPSTSSVYEEFIHTAQMRAGRTGTDWIRQNEIDAAEKLIRFRHQYRIPNAETRQTIERLRQLRGGQ